MAPNDSLAVRIDKCFEAAGAIIKQHLPYVYGGGHGSPPFTPSGSPVKGLDCSGFASMVLKAGGLLASPPALAALDVADFERWGVPGRGELTLWVRNDSVQQHCFLDFYGFGGEHQHKYCEASHPGTYVRWLEDESFGGFSPRTTPADW
jgi:hypothetical protein